MDRRAMTYKLKHNILHNIQNEAQAYCLGCFYFHTNGRIQLHKKNIEILSIIQEIFEYDGPIRIYNNICELYISQKQFIDSLNFNNSVLPDLTPELHRHFIRGIFDLYGSAYLVKKKYLNINIVQQETFINNLRDFIHTNLHIDTKHYYRYSYTNTIQMMITRTNYAKRFLEWIYRDANYYLTRKFQIWDKYNKKSV